MFPVPRTRLQISAHSTACATLVECWSKFVCVQCAFVCVAVCRRFVAVTEIKSSQSVTKARRHRSHSSTRNLASFALGQCGSVSTFCSFSSFFLVTASVSREFSPSCWDCCTFAVRSVTRTHSLTHTQLHANLAKFCAPRQAEGHTAVIYLGHTVCQLPFASAWSRVVLILPTGMPNGSR